MTVMQAFSLSALLVIMVLLVIYLIKAFGYLIVKDNIGPMTKHVITVTILLIVAILFILCVLSAMVIGGSL